MKTKPAISELTVVFLQPEMHKYQNTLKLNNYATS